jgi:hypothetical protein
MAQTNITHVTEEKLEINIGQQIRRKDYWKVSAQLG